MKLGDTVTYRDKNKKPFTGVIVRTFGFTVIVRNEAGEERQIGRRAMKVVPKEKAE